MADSSSLKHITILLDPSTHRSLAYQMTQILISCINEDHIMATFLPPLDFQRILEWWLDVFSSAEKTSRQPKPKTWIVATLVPKSDMEISSHDGGKKTEEELMKGRGLDGFDVAGYAYLVDNGVETGPFRGEVLKMMVDPRCRRMGVAKAVMQKIEEVAAGVELTRLVLDTTSNVAAEYVYPRLGWLRIGVIPAEGISPHDGRLIDTVFFYKLLPGHPASGSIWKGAKGKETGSEMGNSEKEDWEEL